MCENCDLHFDCWLQGLDAFLLVITQSGKILYASDSVTPLINHLPVSDSYIIRNGQNIRHMNINMGYFNNQLWLMTKIIDSSKFRIFSCGLEQGCSNCFDTTLDLPVFH